MKKRKKIDNRIFQLKSATVKMSEQLLFITVMRNSDHKKIIFQKQPPEVLVKFFKVFVKILQNSQENTCSRVSF